MLDKIWKKSNTIWINPESRCTKKNLESSPKYRKLVPFETRSKKRIAVLSNPIARNRSFQHTFPAICIEKVVFMKSGDGNTPTPPGQQVRKRLDQQFEGLEEYDERLDSSSRWRFYPSSRTTHSSSSRWQLSSDWNSTWSWDSWQTSSWTEQLFFLLLFRDVISLAGNLISWQSTGEGVNSTPTAHHFSHAQLSRSLVAVLLS